MMSSRSDVARPVPAEGSHQRRRHRGLSLLTGAPTGRAGTESVPRTCPQIERSAVAVPAAVWFAGVLISPAVPDDHQPPPSRGGALQCPLRQQKAAICSGFVFNKEPSDGLGPSTPSLPWRIRGATAVRRNRALGGVFPAATRFLVLGSPPPRRPLSIPEKPRTCPQDLSPKMSSPGGSARLTRRLLDVGGRLFA
jgi:hypothetical protein